MENRTDFMKYCEEADERSYKEKVRNFKNVRKIFLAVLAAVTVAQAAVESCNSSVSQKSSTAVTRKN